MNDTTVCTECGQQHLDRYRNPACTSHVTRERADANGYRAPLPEPRPCKNPPMPGQKICAKHGGRARQNRAAGERRVTEENAARVLRRFGEPIDTTPTEALLDAVKWTAGYVSWLRNKVAEIGTDEDLVWGVTKETEGDVVVGFGSGASLDKAEGVTREAKPNAWVELLGVWHDRLVRICSEAIKAGIEERRVKLAEQQGALVADVIRKVLDDLNLTPEQAARAGNVVPLRLRELAS